MYNRTCKFCHLWDADASPSPDLLSFLPTLQQPSPRCGGALRPWMHQSIKHLTCINPPSICHASIYQASVMHQSIKHLSCINLPSICHASIYQASVLPLPEKTPCCHPACVLVVTENIAGNDTSKKSGSQPRRLLTNKWAGYILVGVRMNVNCSIVLKNMI